MAMKMDVWQWGDVKGVDEELCNNLALFAEDNKIDCMNMTEKEFVALKDEYLMILFTFGIFKVIQINLYTKLQQTHRCRKLMVTKGGKKEKDKLGG